MEYRHEWKHEINRADLLVLRSRLACVMQTDPHAIDGLYRIRSLYFDTPADRALREKIDGVDHREKFRIRFYNGDDSFIVLERKVRENGLTGKESERLTRDEAARIAAGDTGWMAACDRPLCRALYRAMTTERLAPKTIVDYTREAFVFTPGNVRVTLDHDIRCGLSSVGLFDRDTVTVPVPDDPLLLEVKWGAFLPDLIRDAVSLPGRRAVAFSKYAQSRIFG